MWLSEQAIRRQRDESPKVATVTIGGQHPAAQAGREWRGMTVLAPGGYVWLPGQQEEVLTMACETGEQAVAGAKLGEVPAGMMPGEVYIHAAGGAGILLKNDGQIQIRGKVSLQGEMDVTGALRVNGLPVAVQIG